MRYTKRQITIDAFHWTYTDAQEDDPKWLSEAFRNKTIYFVDMGESSVHLMIKTLEGQMRATPGDYIIRGIKGEIYPCKPDIFEATYYPKQPDQDPGPPFGEKAVG